MDDVLPLLLLLGGLFVGVPILAILVILGWTGLRRLERRQRELEAEVARLRRQVVLAARAAEPPPPPPVAPQPVAPQPVAPRPAPTPSAPPSKPVRTSPAPKIDWERWIGIRGAALAGAVALALAGLLFFKYSIDHGWIGPTMRVALGTLVGLGCLAGSEVLRARGYGASADGVAGGGIVVLYAAFWAAHVLYGLVPLTVSFVLMGLVTAACCLLSLRHASYVVAVLGLVGGFATPLLLSQGPDRPLGLFGYVLLLDLGLLAVGRRRGWSSLAAMALFGTALLQGLWILGRMDSGRMLFGLAILGVFAAVFLVASGRPREPGPDGGAIPALTRAGSVLFPFAFAFYFAARVELGERLLPIALLLGGLSAAACWLARQERTSMLGVGAAAATTAVLGVWMVTQPPSGPYLLSGSIAAVALAAVFHVSAELERSADSGSGISVAGMAGVAGPLALLALVALRGPGGSEAFRFPWPAVVAEAALAASLCRQAAFPGRSRLQILAAGIFAAGLAGLQIAHGDRETFPSAVAFLALAAVATAALLASSAARREETKKDADRAAAVLALIVLFSLPLGALTHGAGIAGALVGPLALGALVAVAATRLAGPIWLAFGVGATWLAQTDAIVFGPDGGAPAPSLVLLAISALAFAAWPFFAIGRFRSGPVAWRTAALAIAAWFVPMREVWREGLGRGAIGLLPLALGAVAAGGAFLARRRIDASSPVRRTAIVWLSAVAVCLLSAAIPLQLEKEWITVGWALEGLGLLLLWRRLDHPGLKWFALALLAAVTLRLVGNPWLLFYHPRPATRILNWLAYTYLVPAASLVASAAVLRPLEVARARPAEVPFYVGKRPLGSAAVGLAAVAIVFVWINLAISDWFSTGSTVELSFGETPPQRLAVSLAWAAYALLLLTLGMARKVSGLRWLSLGLLLATIAKVFLYDLGNLQDLWRVASLAGLAVSLILVSLLYQKFVFRRDDAPRSGDPG